MRKTEPRKERIRAAGRRAIEENQEALRILEAHDREEFCAKPAQSKTHKSDVPPVL